MGNRDNLIPLTRPPLTEGEFADAVADLLRVLSYLDEGERDELCLEEADAFEGADVDGSVDGVGLVVRTADGAAYELIVRRVE